MALFPDWITRVDADRCLRNAAAVLAMVLASCSGNPVTVDGLPAQHSKPAFAERTTPMRWREWSRPLQPAEVNSALLPPVDPAGYRTVRCTLHHISIPGETQRTRRSATGQYPTIEFSASETQVLTQQYELRACDVQSSPSGFDTIRFSCSNSTGQDTLIAVLNSSRTMFSSLIFKHRRWTDSYSYKSEQSFRIVLTDVQFGRGMDSTLRVSLRTDEFPAHLNTIAYLSSSETLWSEPPGLQYYRGEVHRTIGQPADGTAGSISLVLSR